MLRKISKSALKAVDDIIMSSAEVPKTESSPNVMEKISEGTTEESQEEKVVQSTSKVSSISPPKPPPPPPKTKLAPPSSTEVTKGPKVRLTDRDKCDSEENYQRYLKRISGGVSQACKHFNAIYRQAVNQMQLNYTLSEKESTVVLKELKEALDLLEHARNSAVSFWTVEHSLEDQFMDSYYAKFAEVRCLFDIKFVQSSSSSKASSLIHSTGIDHQQQLTGEDFVIPQPRGFEIEASRQKAETAMAAIHEAESSILAQKEKRKQEIEKFLEGEMKMFDEQRKLLQDGGIPPLPSPVPSVSTSCVAPDNDGLVSAASVRPSQLLLQPSSVQPPPAAHPPRSSQQPPYSAMYNCRFCPQQETSIEKLESHVRDYHQILSHDLLPPSLPARATTTAQVESEKDFGVMGQLIQRIASKQFDVKLYVSQKFSGENSKENYQNYSLWRCAWRRAAKKLEQMGTDPEEMYDYLTMCLDGEAKKIVGTHRINENTYALMLKKLDSRYLNPTLYLREVSNSLAALPKMKDTKDSLMKGINAMESGWENLQARNLSNAHLSMLFFLQQNEPKLSPLTQKLWSAKRTKARDDQHPLGFNLTIEDFFQCLHEAETNVIYSDTPKGNENNENNQNRNRANIFGAHSTDNNEDSNTDKVPSDGKKCPLPGCKQNAHKLILKCPMLPKISAQELSTWVKNNKVSCKMCLSTTHKTDSCPGFASQQLHKCKKIIKEGPRAGQQCEGMHCVFLHFDQNPRNRRNGQKPQNQVQHTEAQQAVVPQPQSHPPPASQSVPTVPMPLPTQVFYAAPPQQQQL